MVPLAIGSVLLLLHGCRPAGHPETTPEFKNWAGTPPMGWNSFDAYDCRINEMEYKAHVDYIAENLKEFGWEYAVIDYVWWHPEPGNYDTPRRFGHPNIRYRKDGGPVFPEYTNIDEYGRLLPAVERFPSAEGGKGFKPLADYVHGKGLKFGIHIMRGIHRIAWYKDLPIMGSDYSARDIAEPFDTCQWLNHMFGVDGSKPGAQEYYNSLFNLYAAWGVDFIKADDMLVPKYHIEEIEMMRKAIDQCGRPIVLSLSPGGEAPVSRASHLDMYANMWRISGDLWDEWRPLRHMFDLLNSWSPFIGNGTWPDADMLPLGRISLNNRPHGPERWSQLTWNEQVTMMSLWAIAKSPMMIGSDLLTIPDSTKSLYTNPEVIALNQHSMDNRQVYRFRNQDEDLVDRYVSVLWTALEPESGDRYLGLFNLLDEHQEICFPLEWEGLRGEYTLRDIWQRKDLGKVSGEVCQTIGPHASRLFRLKRDPADH